MTIEELYQLLEIDSPADVEYFEQLADLMEADADIPKELFCHALSALSAENAGDFAENYIGELSGAIPEGLDAEILSESLAAMEQRLLLLAEDFPEAKASSDLLDPSRMDFASELYKLRSWLKEEGAVLVDERPASLLHALTEMRAEKLGLGAHTYDLSSLAELTPEEISYNLGAFEKIEL